MIWKKSCSIDVNKKKQQKNITTLPCQSPHCACMRVDICQVLKNDDDK
jgi:hypothetical protein